MEVFIIAAISADGFIGRHQTHSADWTSKEDKKLFVELTKKAGVMVMGSTTFQTIGRGLPGRKTIVYTSKPDAFQNVEGEVEFTSEDPAVLLSRLQKDGYKSIAICGGAHIYGQFLEKKLVTDIYLSIEPLLFGNGVPLSLGASETKLELQEQRMLNKQTVLLHYKVLNS